jgi:hypothetical protein
VIVLGKMTEVLERVLVPGPPGVEVLTVLRVEVLTVLSVASARVAVRRDDGVVAVGPVDRGVTRLHLFVRLSWPSHALVARCGSTVTFGLRSLTGTDRCGYRFISYMQ